MSIVNAFQKKLKQSARKPNKIWADKGSEFYNSSFKKWLQDNDISMYSTHDIDNSVVAERFIRTINNRIYKDMTSILKNVHIDKLDDIVDEYNNTYHRAIKMKPIDVKDNTYINIDKEVNDNDPKFKVGDHVRISKYKNIFAKCYTPNLSEKVFVIKKMILMVEKLLEHFMKKELQKIDKQESRIEKVIKKGDKLYAKWKVY